MSNGYASPKSPNKAAPVTNVALKGSRTNVVKHGAVETSADRSVNTKSSNQAPNLTAKDQTRSGS